MNYLRVSSSPFSSVSSGSFSLFWDDDHEFLTPTMTSIKSFYINNQTEMLKMLERENPVGFMSLLKSAVYVTQITLFNTAL